MLNHCFPWDEYIHAEILKKQENAKLWHICLRVGTCHEFILLFLNSGLFFLTISWDKVARNGIKNTKHVIGLLKHSVQGKGICIMRERDGG